MIIDIHAHAYPERIAKKVKERMESVSGSRVENVGTPEALVEGMEKNGVNHSVFLPVATNPGQVGKLNAQAIRWMEEYGNRGLVSFAAVHPDTAELKMVMRGIRNSGLRGIKIHPDYQETYFDDIRYLRILDAAAEEGLLVLVHAGMDEVYPDQVHCDVKRILRVLEEVECSHLILAHMGGWQMWTDVKKYICGAPVYMDTAFSLTGTVSVENRGVYGKMLDDHQFTELVRLHGSDRVLFGSDTPWSSQKENLEWIQKCSLNPGEKTQILGENARKLLTLG
ncbi:MAG: amidohydrolase family protein [Eubacterium sp.]|nr:amidohydrolase family protein [Eubacterium sp.]